MDVYFTAPDAGGSVLFVFYTFFNAGVFVDYNFVALAPSAGSKFEDLRQLAITSMNSYATLKGYTVTNSVRYYPDPATATVEGVMTAADKSKLDGLSAIGALSFNNTPGRSIVTGTGATGFQVSSTKNSIVGYNVTITTAVQIGVATNVDGYVVLEIAPTNSATPSDWVEISRTPQAQNIGLALALSSTQKGGGRIGGVIPVGYYAKIRSINTAGTPTYAYNSGQEVILPI